MTKKEFVELFAKKADLKKKVEAERMVKVFIETVEDVLMSGDAVSFIGFGKFDSVQRASRKCINPQTKKEMTVPAKKVAKFKAGKVLNEKLNGTKKVAAKPKKASAKKK